MKDDPTHIEAYNPHLGKAPLASGVVINSAININDAWVFTPFFRNTQFILRNDNLFYTNPAAHEAFLIVFILGAIAMGVQSILAIFGIGRRKNLAEILQKSKLEKFEPSSSQEAAKPEEESRRLIEEINVLAEAYILDPENNYKPIYAVLISGPGFKKPLVAKRVVNAEDLDVETNRLKEEIRRDLLQQLATDWAKLETQNKKTVLALLNESVAKLSFSDLLNFFFKMALWYWILWIVSAGFFGFGATGIAFSSPLIAFLLPVVLTLAEYLIHFIVAYRNRNSAANPKLNALVENLLKIKLASEVDKTTEKPSLAACKNLSELKAWAETQVSEIKAIVNEKTGSDKILNVKSNLRIGLNTVMGFANFFIITSFIAWPLADLLAVHGITATALFAAGSLASSLSLIIVPMVISILVGALFAVSAYREACEREQKLKENLKNNAIAQAKEQLDNLILEVKLRRAYLKARGITDLLSPASIENPNFATYLSLEARSEKAVWLTRIKKFFHRADIALNSLGAGTLLVRLVLGVLGSLAQLGLMASFSYLSTAVIVPIVLVAVIWTGVALLQFYQNRQLEKAEQSLSNISTELELYEQENAWLKAKEATLPPLAATPAVSKVQKEGAFKPVAGSPVPGGTPASQCSSVTAVSAEASTPTPTSESELVSAPTPAFPSELAPESETASPAPPDAPASESESMPASEAGGSASPVHKS